MEKKGELKFTISSRWVHSIPEFICDVEHNLDPGPDIEWAYLTIQAPIINDNEAGYIEHVYGKGLVPTFGFRYLRKLSPESHIRAFEESPHLTVQKAISEYKLTPSELKQLQTYWLPGPEINPQTNEYFGSILTKILEKAGYVVTIEVPEYFFPSPTGAGLVSPVFSMGLRKTVKPEEIEDGYETTLIYLSHEKPLSKVQIQIGVFDHLPEERLNELQRSFKDNLSPYGLKSLYLVIEECGHNKRNPWFILDTNKCLDLMGYKRTQKSVHRTKNRTRLLNELEGLTRINFNVERRTRKHGVKDTDKVIKFKAPLLSITGNFEEWEVEKDRPIEEGTLIKDNVQIFLHPQIYADIGDWYTFIPHAFLTIDARSKPHAILLYPYIANQWRIGWHQYHGIIRQPIRQILDGAGLMSRLPKRANQQRDFINNIKESLKWLRDQPEFWIKKIRFETKNKALFDQIITITMADEHPLKMSMTKKITK